MSKELDKLTIRKPLVCLIDDDDMMLSLFTRILQRTGCDVVAAKGPIPAASILATHTVDVVISDLRMPDIADGEKLLAEIHHAYPGLTIWMMSSEFRNDMRNRLMNAGAAQCIEKPFSTKSIALMIDQLDKPNLMRGLDGIQPLSR